MPASASPPSRYNLKCLIEKKLSIAGTNEGDGWIANRKEIPGALDLRRTSSPGHAGNRRIFIDWAFFTLISCSVPVRLV
jgi:hypothetical protein